MLREFSAGGEAEVQLEDGRQNTRVNSSSHRRTGVDSGRTTTRVCVEISTSVFYDVFLGRVSWSHHSQSSLFKGCRRPQPKDKTQVNASK